LSAEEKIKKAQEDKEEFKKRAQLKRDKAMQDF